MNRMITRAGLAVGIAAALLLAVVSPASAATFGVWSLQSHKCMDVPNGSTSNNTPIIQWTCHGGTNQQWDFNWTGNGYQVVNRNSGKCLDVRNGSTADVVDLIQYTCTGASNQLWDTRLYASNYYQLVAKHSNKCADVENGRTHDGANIIQYTCTGTNNQLWLLLS